jgi:hypothetical protein
LIIDAGCAPRGGEPGGVGARGPEPGSMRGVAMCRSVRGTGGGVSVVLLTSRGRGGGSPTIS